MLRWILFQRLQVRFAILGLSLLAATFGLLGPLFQKLFVDHLLGAETLSLAGIPAGWLSLSLPWLVIVAFACAVLAHTMSIGASYVALREGTYIQRVLGESLYFQMLGRRNDQWGGRTVGEIVQLYAADVPGSTALIDQTLPMGASIVFPLLIAPLAIYTVSGLPIGTVWTVVGIIVLINFILANRQSRFFHRFKQLAGERIAIVNEWVQNIRVLRILSWVEPFEEKIRNKRIEETTNRVRMVTNGQTMGAMGSSISFVVNVLGVVAVVRMKQDAVTPGELFALLWIFGVFLNRPFRQIPWIFTFTLDALTSLRRIETFIRAEDLHVHPPIPTPRNLPTTPAHLKVQGLCLSYKSVPILRDIDLEVKPGEFVAIVGEVGSGKTQLLQSLMGETPAQFSRFEVDGQDLASQPASLRRAYFGFVPQEGFVMSSTLRDNVAFQYHTPPILDDEILKALAESQFDLKVERVNGDLSAEIGERGVNLSGGQKQRVSLARANYLDRPILLLDDSLSAVDVDTENKLYDSLLNGAWKNRTRLLVTHRLSILSKVDRIYFIQDGRVAAHGSLAQLKAQSTDFCRFIMTHEEDASPPPEAPASLTVVVSEDDSEGGLGDNTPLSS